MKFAHSSSATARIKAACLGALTLTTLVFAAQTGPESSRALTNWLAATSSFKKAGALVVEEKYSQAKAELSSGTANLAVDQIFDTQGNGDMFVNSIDWSAEQENLVNLTPKQTTDRTFNPPSQLHWILVLLSTIFIIPGLVVLGGVSTWLARRRQG